MKSLRFVRNLFFCAVLLVLLVPSAPAFASLDPVAGYIELEPISYSLRLKGLRPMNLKTAQNEVFYSFFPADDAPDQKPLFVMLNGGPGAATATNLFAMNTAPYTLDRERVCKAGEKDCKKGYAENPWSWTAMGNLLYIDAPGTGFSYLVSKLSTTWAGRATAFNKGNFNPVIDADHIVRVILRFLAQHKEILGNEVILVGESYGGTRVSTMLNMLLFSDRYSEKGMGVLGDQGLVDEIIAHFKAVDELEQKKQGGDSNSTQPVGVDSTNAPELVKPLTPERVAEQFGRQILIQPSLSGKYQDSIQGEMFYGRSPYHDNVIKNIAKETKVPFPSKNWMNYGNGWLYCASPLGSKSACVLMWHMPREFKRDSYNDVKPASWSDDLEAFAARSLRNYEVLKTILKYDPKDIKKMYASERKYAFKVVKNYDKKASGAAQQEADSEKQAFAENEAGEKKLSQKESEENARKILTDAFGKEMSEDLLKEKHPLNSRFLSMFQEDQNLAMLEAGLEDLPGQTLEGFFGTLSPHDTYMDPMNTQIYIAFIASLGTTLYGLNADLFSRYGEMFLENVQLVDTFLTDAQQDLVIYSPAIPEALKKHTSVVRTVDYKRGHANTPGTFEIIYKGGAFKESLKDPKSSVSLYYPHYDSSGHSVSSEQPDKLFKDVQIWLGAMQN